MKKIFFSMSFLLFTVTAFSQGEKILKHSRDFYLKKSKNQKTIANVFAITGGISLLTSLVIPKGEMLPPSFCFWNCYEYKNQEVKATFGGISILCLITSIPLYLASSKNKRKAGRATTINFNNQRILFPQQGSFVFKTQPSLTLKIHL